MILLGIDLGIGKMAISVFHDGDPRLGEPPLKLLNVHWLTTSSVDQQDGINARAAQLHELGEYAYQLAVVYSADHVFIESIIMGNNHKYSLQLAQTLGAVLKGLSPGSSTRGCRLHLVDNKTWKKHVVGNGNASKEDVRNYIDVTHPSYALLCEGDQDRYDACAIGLYGVSLIDQAATLRLQS